MLDQEKVQAADRMLLEKYDAIRAYVLIGTWLKFQLLGEDYLMKTMNRQTFWRHRRWIMEAGLEWNGRRIGPLRVKKGAEEVGDRDSQAV